MKAWYAVFGLLQLAFMLFALYCASHLGQWAIGMVLAIFFIEPLEHMREWCWQEYRDRRDAAGCGGNSTKETS